jgi:hypothetical protein
MSCSFLLLLTRDSASRAGTRCVSNLSAGQLARKRAHDRESQRVSRERTKENIEKFERQIEEQKRQIEEQKLSIEWMKQLYSQLESEMRAQGVVMTLMLNATPSNQSNNHSGLDVPLRMPQNIYDNIGSMRRVDWRDATEEIRVKVSGADFTPGYSPLNVSFSTLPVFEWPTGNITDARCMNYT